MTMADQVILLRAGRVEQDAAPEVLYARPATAFVARFVGTPPMNVLGCADRRVLLGVRPEEVRLAAADEPGAVPAVVQTVEYLGADSILTCALGTQSIAARVAGRIALAPGTTVSLAWPRAAVHLFDVETGGRLDEIADIPSIAS
jgi:sn-glycerol 3-phosphate transport system ATP-binding protein